MTAPPNWPGTADKPALGYRAGFARPSLQLPFATENAETDAPEVLWGPGSPEGLVVGTIGDSYHSTDGAGLFYKKSGVNTNTGWEVAGVTTALQNRWIEWRVKPQKGQVDGDGVTMSTLEGYTRFASDSVVGQNSGIQWKPAASTLDQLFFKIQDGRKGFMLKPGTLNQANNAIRMEWRPRGLAEPDMPYMLDFRESFGPTTSVINAALLDGLHAISILAWLRKEASGSSTHARVGFGFCDHSLTFPSKTVARIGVHGNGVLGYRFGSVHCPDGFGSGDTGTTDIDANSVAPAEIVDPAASWFHAEIKLVPPTPTQGGRWYAKLNGVTVGTFTTNTNFPRGSQATNRNYVGIIPAIWAYPDTVQIPGVIVDDLRIRISEDLT